MIADSRALLLIPAIIHIYSSHQSYNDSCNRGTKPRNILSQRSADNRIRCSFVNRKGIMKQIYSFVIAYASFSAILLLVPLLALRWFFVTADRKRTEWIMAAAVLFKTIGVFSLFISNNLSRLRPLKYDLYVFQIDSFFGNPSFHLGGFVASHHWILIPLSITYDGLEMAAFGTFVVYLYLRPNAETLQLVKAFLLNLIVAVPCYLLFPVCGPGFAFRSYPALPPLPLVPHMVAISAAPDGVPSVHTSTALLILYFMWRWPWGRMAAFIFLVLTVLATLGSGQHYLFDLICAIPYTAAILWANNKLSARSAAQKNVQEEAYKFS